MNHDQATSRYRELVAEAIVEYATKFDTERAGFVSRFGEDFVEKNLVDFRGRNAKLKVGDIRLLYRPVVSFKEVTYKDYEHIAAQIPWRMIQVIPVYKTTAKKLFIGREKIDSPLLRYIEDPGDPIDIDDMFRNRIHDEMRTPFHTVDASIEYVELFPTPEEAFETLPEAHRITRAEMESRVDEEKSKAWAKRLDWDVKNRFSTCYFCGELIGMTADYYVAMYHDTKGRVFAHCDCRKCATCGGAIEGEYISREIVGEPIVETQGSVTIYAGRESLGLELYHPSCVKMPDDPRERRGWRQGDTRYETVTP